MEEKHITHEDEQLKKRAPRLFSVERHVSPFQIPEQYFASFPSRVSSLVLLRAERAFEVPDGYFEQLPGKLKILTLQQETSPAMQAPEGYFDRLPHTIQERANSATRGFIKPGFSRLAIPVFAATAIFALLFGLVVNIPQNENQKTALNITKLSAEEAEGSLLETADESFLIEQVVASTETGNSQEALSDYLIENQIDLNTLANEL